MSCNNSSRSRSIAQNVCAREAAEQLFGMPVARKFDITQLRPEERPRGQRFETVADSLSRRDAELARFKKIAGLTHVVDRIFDCSASSPCAEVNCPMCTRSFRRWLTGQALQYSESISLEVYTLALELVPRGKLENCDLPVVKDRVAQRFRRAALSVKFVLGGIEAEYQHSNDAFIVHAHLLVSQLPRDEKKALRSAFANIDAKRTAKIQPLRDAPRQISYLLKFATYHRPGSQTGSRRAAAFPLPDHALKALTLWRARHSLMDFVFMMGFRRKGSDLVRINA